MEEGLKRRLIKEVKILMSETDDVDDAIMYIDDLVSDMVSDGFTVTREQAIECLREQAALPGAKWSS